MKKILIIGIPIAVILIVLFLTIGKSSKPSELTQAFAEKVQSNDAKGLMELVEVDENVSWTEEDAKSVITYLKNDSSDLKDQMMILNAQAAQFETDGQATSVIAQTYPGDSISNVGSFYIEKKDGIFGDKYALKARGYDLKISAPKGAKVLFNGKSIDMEGKETKDLGLFGPGVYALEGQKKFDYTTVNDETTVTLFDEEDFEEEANLSFSGETITLNSDIPNTTLLVNGKKSDETISEGTEFGPVKGGITIQGVADFPWGKGKSKKVVVKDDASSYDVTPNPIVNDDMKNNIKVVINDFAKNRITAKVEKNPDMLKNVSDNVKKDYTEQIESYDDKNYFEGKALGTRIDFSEATYENGSGGNQLIHIPVEFHEKSREVYEYVDTDLEEEYVEEKVTLQYDEKKKRWIIQEEVNDYNSMDDDYMTSKEVEKTTFE